MKQLTKKLKIVKQQKESDLQAGWILSLLKCEKMLWDYHRPTTDLSTHPVIWSIEDASGENPFSDMEETLSKYTQLVLSELERCVGVHPREVDAFKAVLKERFRIEPDNRKRKVS
ncbi:hypothetical protein L0244_29910 [bacterium]|nr:hypothetical protein [bacterium]